MQFVLMGFDQEAALRLYLFQGILNGTRTDFRVRVDLALIASYGIRIQDLPLLCRDVLERAVEGQQKHTLTLGENEMRVYADRCATAKAEAALKRKPRPKLPDGDVGASSDMPPR